MPYLIQATLTAAIPPQFVLEALDDNGDGVADTGVFDQIVANVSAEIDGLLGARYAVPFANPIPAVVADAATKLAAEMLYARRGLDGDKNPWSKRAAEIRALLKKIGAGEIPLTPTIKRQTPGAVAITEPAKTSSKTARTAI